MLSVTPYICKSGTWYYPIRHSSFSFNKARRSQVSYCTICDYKLRHDDIYNLFILDHKGTILIQMKRPLKKNANFQQNIRWVFYWFKQLYGTRNHGAHESKSEDVVWQGRMWVWLLLLMTLGRWLILNFEKNLNGWPVDATVNSSECNKRHGRFGFEVGVFI